MSKGNNKVLAKLQRLGKALMTPVAVIPAAGLLVRLGAADLLNIRWMNAAGNAITGNLPIIFAIGVAVGLAKENNGVSAIAAIVGYKVMYDVAGFNASLNMGVLQGILVGILAAYLYNKYRAIKLPDFLGFFGGKRFVPIVMSFYSMFIGIVLYYVWPHCQGAVNAFGNTLAHAGALGAVIFGFFNRLLIPFGLHHVLNTLFWQQFGSFTTPAGQTIIGDFNRFLAQDPTAGTYMTGFFPIMMFGLPAACLAMIHTAKIQDLKAKKELSGMLLGLAFTSFLTGITEPIEFSFMFLAPGLYVVHAILTASSMGITCLLGIKNGFSFSAGFFDYLLNFGIASKPVLLFGIGLIYAVLYYFVFRFCIVKFNLSTPGRDMEEGTTSTFSSLSDSDLTPKAAEILDAIGGKNNIDVLDACVTRIRLSVNDGKMINESRLKKLGASGVMKLDDKNFQIVVGTIADPLVTHMKELMKN